ncbi:MAG: hypothetical protein SFU86_25490 [Pirellulaceae bacterium]|nr:hypothetical protein [Pirellulaceae bacterium]
MESSPRSHRKRESLSRRQWLQTSVAGLGGLTLVRQLAGSGASSASAADKLQLPPGWLPISKLDDSPTWSDFRKINDKIHLYLPPGVETVRGVFVCFVFHSADARELACHWKFALVTVPWPFEFDLGVNDKRNGRFQVGHPVGDMSILLRYLEHAAHETKHPELAVCPLVGWLGQNGSHLCGDLHQRAPQRVLAWSDSFANRLAQYPELTKQVPFAYAWETSKREEQERLALREMALATVKDQPTPPPDFGCRANTYGFSHGIYSKFNFFMAFLDRCIALRMPAETPQPGEPAKLAPISVSAGWAGDFNPVSQWNPIAPAAEAKGMVSPMWLPDAYAAWMWRSYHSANPDIKLAGPIVEYRKKDGEWGGPECGLGYGGQLAASASHHFAAQTTGNYEKIEFHAGDQVVGEATSAPWTCDGVKLAPGLQALFAVGIAADGTRTASRPGFVVVG